MYFEEKDTPLAEDCQVGGAILGGAPLINSLSPSLKTFLIEGTTHMTSVEIASAGGQAAAIATLLSFGSLHLYNRLTKQQNSHDQSPTF